MEALIDKRTPEQKLAAEIEILEGLEVEYYKVKYSGKYSETLARRIEIRSYINNTKERIKQLRKEMQNDNDRRTN